MLKFRNKSIIAMVTAIIAVGGCLIAGLTGCSSTTSDTTIEYGFSDFNGEKTKDIYLNTDVNQLNMDGKISMTSGKVRLFVNVKANGKELYSKEFTSENNGIVKIDIDNIGSDKDLVFGLDVENAKNFELSLKTQQKLVREPEVPKPSKQ